MTIWINAVVAQALDVLEVTVCFSDAHQTLFSQKMKDDVILDLSDVSVFSSADVLSGLVSLLPKQLLDSKIHTNTPSSLHRVLKGTAHTKKCWKCVHSQFIRDMDGFVSSSGLEKCVSVSVSQQWMLCSEWVPSEWESMDALQWMGAVRMRVNGCTAVNGCRQNESLIKTS